MAKSYRYRFANQAEILAAAMEILESRKLYKAGTSLNSSQAARDLCKLKIYEQGDADKREHFLIVYLDNQHNVITSEINSSGTIDGASVYPREVVRRVVELGAAAVILAHNHPSGNVEPSDADRHITRRLVDALALIDTRVLDHIIVTRESYMAFAERGLI